MRAGERRVRSRAPLVAAGTISTPVTANSRAGHRRHSWHSHPFPENHRNPKSMGWIPEIPICIPLTCGEYSF
jgi:hypothetical protein